jgi:tetratricopeptide (TPR) repeat protein
LIGTSEENSQQQVEYFQKAVDLAPDFSAARYNLALIYLKREQRELALNQLDALIALEPDGTSAYLLRARVRLEGQDPGRAAEDLERALELDPENYDTWQLMGRIRYEQREYEQAARAFAKVVALRPNPVGAYFDLALSQQSLGHGEEAIKNYRRFLMDVPDDFQANYFLGILYREAGQDDLALELFLKAESIEPTQQELAKELGNLLLDQNQLEEAQERLQRSNLDLAVNLANLGVIAKRRERYIQAEDYFRRALLKEPDNPLLWAQLGDVLAQTESPLEEAIEAYETALRYDPQDLATLYNLGTLYVNEGRFDEAIDSLGRALSIDPQHGGAHYNLALVLDERKDFDEARVHYLKAIEYGSDSAWGRLRLTFLWARQNEPAEALKHLEVAFEREPQRYVRLILDELLKISSDRRTGLRSVPRYLRSGSSLGTLYSATRFPCRSARGVDPARTFPRRSWP